MKAITKTTSKNVKFTYVLHNQWIVDALEELHNGIAGTLAFDDKVDPQEAYCVFMSVVDKLIDKIYKTENVKRPVYKMNKRDF